MLPACAALLLCRASCGCTSLKSAATPPLAPLLLPLMPLLNV